MSKYKEKINAKTLLALCFAEASETYHHWRVFTAGADGVCISFNKAYFEEHLEAYNGFKCGSIKYEKINDAKTRQLNTQELPFVKRLPYEDEREFRILFIDEDKKHISKELPISVDAIKRITLSPWLPKQLVNAVKTSFKAIDGCSNLKVYQTTLIDNQPWQNIADKAEPS